MKKGIFLCGTGIICWGLISGQGSSTIAVGLFYDKNVTGLVISIQGVYDLLVDGVVHQLTTGDGVKVNVKEKKVYCTLFPSGTLLSGYSIRLLERRPGSIATIKCTRPGIRRYYRLRGDLELRFNGYFIQVVNTTFMDDYLGGVIEAEVGRNRNIEFYKAKAVLARTFAIYNQSRHYLEGFNMCDGTHCQVFYGITSDTTIMKAVKATTGEVLITPDRKVAFAPYHSNCGGETGFSDGAWSFYSPYLVPVFDTFCSNGEHYLWTREISFHKFKEFLKRSYGPRALDDNFIKQIFQENSRITTRKKYLVETDTQVRMVDMRNYFNLPSAFFEMHYNGNGTVILKGRGFGHGVGFCQEGAIEMSKRGYTYKDILKHYFPMLIISGDFNHTNTHRGNFQNTE